METRVAVMSIIVENGDAVERINSLLHEHGDWIIDPDLQDSAMVMTDEQYLKLKEDLF